MFQSLLWRTKKWCSQISFLFYFAFLLERCFIWVLWDFTFCTLLPTPVFTKLLKLVIAGLRRLGIKLEFIYMISWLSAIIIFPEDSLAIFVFFNVNFSWVYYYEIFSLTSTQLLIFPRIQMDTLIKLFLYRE